MGSSGTGQRGAPRRGGVVVGLILVAVLTVPMGWPWIEAWWIYPSPPPVVFRAAVQATAAEQRFVIAYDASGRVHQVPAGAITDATPDRCTRWYRTDDFGRSGARGLLPFAGGMAEFTCLAGITATGHGPLQAVALLTLYTRPGTDAPPRANLLPDGPYARQLLAELRP